MSNFFIKLEENDEECENSSSNIQTTTIPTTFTTTPSINIPMHPQQQLQQRHLFLTPQDDFYLKDESQILFDPNTPFFSTPPHQQSLSIDGSNCLFPTPPPMWSIGTNPSNSQQRQHLQKFDLNNDNENSGGGGSGYCTTTDIFCQVDKADLIQLDDLNFDELLIPEENGDSNINNSHNDSWLMSQTSTSCPSYMSSQLPQQHILEQQPQHTFLRNQQNFNFDIDNNDTTSSMTTGVDSSDTPPPPTQVPPPLVVAVEKKHSTLHELLMRRNVTSSTTSSSSPPAPPPSIVTTKNKDENNDDEFASNRISHSLRLSTSAPSNNNQHLATYEQLWQRREPRTYHLSTGSTSGGGGGGGMGGALSTSSLSTSVGGGAGGGILSPEPHFGDNDLFSQDEYDFEEDDYDDNNDDYNINKKVTGGAGDSDDLSTDNESDDNFPLHASQHPPTASTPSPSLSTSAIPPPSSSSAPSTKERYFWQYNVQAKGPKGQRLVMKSRMEDPHILHQVQDPVFSAECSGVRGIKHSGKARKGDGNDLTPNARKLLNIGRELDKLGRIINDMTPVSELPFSVRPRSRKEKNKLASRACRLKKKAQHEANKIKLNGLEFEHKNLLAAISACKDLMFTKINDSGAEMDENISLQIENATKTAQELKVAGQTTNYVNKILERLKKNSSTSTMTTATSLFNEDFN